MADYRQIPEQIRTFLDGPRDRWTEELADVADGYASLCREANDRLDRCADYLRRGMRSEAVHLADCPPKLPDLIAHLQIPDLCEWDRACMGAGLGPAPRLQLAGVDGLTNAQARERLLQPLLERHRVLALARTAIRDRLTVTRALAAADPENPCWDEEVRTLETTRLRELRRDAAASVKSRDRSALEAMAAELTGVEWRADVPTDLRSALEKVVRSIRRGEAVAQIRGLAAQMVDAAGAKRHADANQLLVKWQELVGPGEVAVPDDVQEQIRPVLAWMLAEDRRQDAEQRMKGIGQTVEDGDVVLRGELARRKAAIVLLTIAGAIACAAGVLAVLMQTYK